MKWLLIILLLFFVLFTANPTRNKDQPYWLSGGGISAACDYAVFTQEDYQQLFLWIPPIGKIPLIYVHVRFVKQLSGTIHHIPFSFVLLSGHGDNSNPSEIFDDDRDFRSFVDSKNLVHWFSQNCVVLDHPKVSPMPIGLNYHTLTTEIDSDWGNLSTPIEQETEFNVVQRTARPFQERLPKIYGNFHFRNYGAKFGYSRQDVVQAIPAACIDYEPTRIKRYDGWLRQTEYAFVVSPHGNGLDCHRTWEALILGCVVIVKSSPLDILYQDLPVIIVQDWKNITVEWLHRVFIEYNGYDMSMDGRVGEKKWSPIVFNVPSNFSKRNEGYSTNKTWGNGLAGLEIGQVFQNLLNRLTDSLMIGYERNRIEQRDDIQRKANMKDTSKEDKYNPMGIPIEDISTVENQRVQLYTTRKSMENGKRRKWAYEKLTLAYWSTLFHSKAGVSPTT